MPPKKGKTSSKSEENVTNNTQGSGESTLTCILYYGNLSLFVDGQLTGSFATDFPILCTKNGLLPIIVRNIETLSVLHITFIICNNSLLMVGNQ